MRWWEKGLVVIANLVVLVNYALARFTTQVCQWRSADLVVLVALANLLMLRHVAAREIARRKMGR